MRKIFIFAMASIFLAIGCSKDKFAEVNTDPDLILAKSVLPETMFPVAVLAMHSNDFEAYYDINRNIMFWNNHWIRLAGMGVSIPSFTTPVTASSRPYRWDNLYVRETMGVGGVMVEMRNIIDKMSDADKAKYVHIRAITYVPMAFAAFYLSDAIGSVAYSDAFKARYTNPPNFKPEYDTQEELYTILNEELKASVDVLRNPLPNQKLLGNNDLYYHGQGDEAKNWAMAANSLRLKIAMRMYKRKPAAAKAIIDEVLADNVGPINSRNASWVFKGGPNTANGGNWNTFGSLSGPKALVDFMAKNGDPRTRNFYRKTRVTEAQFNAAKASGQIPATATYDGDYVGRYISADAVNEADKKFYFSTFPGTSVMYSSEIQTALFNAAVAQGLVNFPVITYADVCFMRAELAARNITTENAEDWYNKGITASILDYNEWAKDAKVEGYTAVTDAEIATYLTKPSIKYDAANGIEQIAIQQYINFFKNPNEAWALRKRTGYPSTSGVIMPFERLMSNGVEMQMPRRWSVVMPPLSDFNYENARAAIEEMQKDPSFGDISNIKGRVWWDAP